MEAKAKYEERVRIKKAKAEKSKSLYITIFILFGHPSRAPLGPPYPVYYQHGYFVVDVEHGEEQGYVATLEEECAAAAAVAEARAVLGDAAVAGNRGLIRAGYHPNWPHQGQSDSVAR